MIYTFHDFIIDTSENTVTHITDKQSIEPTLAHVICFLVEHRQRVVTEQELLAHIHKHSEQKTESAGLDVTKYLQAARALLEQSTEAGEVILAHLDVGYQFVGTLEQAESSSNEHATKEQITNIDSQTDKKSGIPLPFLAVVCVAVLIVIFSISRHSQGG